MATTEGNKEKRTTRDNSERDIGRRSRAERGRGISKLIDKGKEKGKDKERQTNAREATPKIQKDCK